MAAVNYHFGSKEHLYLACLREAVCHSKVEIDGLALSPPTTAEEAWARIRGTIEGIARSLIAERPEVYSKLMHREMLEPSFALDVVHKEMVGPKFRVLREAVGFFLPGANDREITLHAMSIVGQLLYHRAARPMAVRLLGVEAYGPDLVVEIVEHVQRFTARALGVGLAAERAASPTPPAAGGPA